MSKQPDIAHIDNDSPDFHVYDVVRELRHLRKVANSTGSPEEIHKGIDKALGLIERREQYASNMTSLPSEALQRIDDFTASHDWREDHEQKKTKGRLRAPMMSGAVEGQFLKMLAGIHNAKRVLEVGMLTGYSALALAEALPADGVVVTCEVEQHLKDVAQNYFDKSPHGKKIQIRIGKGIEVLSKLVEEGQQFDMIFLDADKPMYIEYFKLAMDKGLLAPGGTLVADNALRLGVSYTGPQDDHVLNPMHMFVQHVNNDDRVNQVLLPFRDGVLMVRRKEDFEGSV